MAQRFRLPVTVISSGPSRLADGWRIALARRDWLLRRWALDPRLFLWQLLWLPYWFGSDRPAPSLPNALHLGEFPNRVPVGGAAGYFQTAMVGLVRRFWMSWLAASLLRGVWLGLLIALVWMLLAIAGVASTPSITVLTICLVLLMCVGVAGGIVNRPAPPMVASMLDRTFLLQERLTTACDAIDLGGGGPHVHWSVPRLQMADAANALSEARHQLSRARFIPVREIIGVLVVGMALLTAIFAYVPDRPLPGVGESPVPGFVPASQRLADPRIADQEPVSPAEVEEPAPTVAEVQEQSRSSQATRDDLGTVGKALQDNPTTQPAADAIAQGDYAAAAESLRSAATRASAMSQEERNALANELEAAAKQISEENPELARASQEAADGLRNGGPEAGTGLSNLGDEIEKTGAGVVPPDQLAQDLKEAQAGAGAEQGSGSQGEGQENGEGQQSQNPASQPGDTGGGALADPGEGVAAKPGVANPEQGGSEPGSASGQQGSEAQGGQGQEGAGSAPEGAAGQPAQEPSGNGAASSGSASGEGGSESSGESGQPGGASQGLTGRPAEETSASQGSGAGTGQTGANDRSQPGQDVDSPAPAKGADPEAEVPQNGKASDKPPTGAGEPGEPGDSGSVSGGSTSIVLEGSSENGVRIGSDSGSSSLGSGSGAGTASGDQVQGQVGVAGPDSNRVPEDKRDIVEDYFSGPKGAP